jgi:mycothiol synthase
VSTHTDVMATPGGVGELAWRPLTADDVGAWTRLLAAAEEIDRTGEHFGESDLAEELADGNIDLARDTVAAARPDGEFAAVGVVRAQRAPTERHRVYIEGCVHPAHRGRGLGRRLLGWLETRAAQSHAERHPHLPGEYEVTPYVQVSSQVRLLERAGYRPVRWWYEMERDLSVPPPPPPSPPDGLRLEPFGPDHHDAVRRAHNEAFAGHWGSSERDAREWAQWYTGSHAFRPEISFVMLDGDEIAGYVLAYHWAADTEATGVKEAWVGQVGTRAAWRGRGVASTLLARALAACTDAGYQRAALSVDSENASGALGLYERLGFVVDARRVSHVKHIAAPAG